MCFLRLWNCATRSIFPLIYKCVVFHRPKVIVLLDLYAIEMRNYLLFLFFFLAPKLIIFQLKWFKWKIIRVEMIWNTKKTPRSNRYVHYDLFVFRWISCLSLIWGSYFTPPKINISLDDRVKKKRRIDKQTKINVKKTVVINEQWMFKKQCAAVLLNHLELNT